MKIEATQIMHAQGSPEWHAWRKTMYTASQAAAVMGAGAWWPRTPRQLWELRTGAKAQPVTWAMRQGQAMEPRALALLRSTVAADAHPQCWEALVDDDLMLGASLDAASIDECWEIKTPARGSSSELWSAEEAPESYRWQMVQQLLCCPRLDRVHLTVYAHDTDEIRSISTITREECEAGPFADLVEAWLQFDAALVEMRQPGLTDADAIDVETVDWELAAAAWLAAKQTAEAAEIAVNEARQSLIAAAKALGGQKAIGGGVMVYRSEREGSIDWRAKAITEALAAAGVNPESHRKKGSTVWTVRGCSNGID
jgi:putative phage-type endonuclease